MHPLDVCYSHHSTILFYSFRLTRPCVPVALNIACFVKNGHFGQKSVDFPSLFSLNFQPDIVHNIFIYQSCRSSTNY